MVVISIKLLITIWNVEALAKLYSHISEPAYTALSDLFVWVVVKTSTLILDHVLFLVHF